MRYLDEMKGTPHAMTIHIARTDADKLACFPVLKELRTHLEKDEFLPQLRRLEAQDYQLAFVRDEGEVTAVAGFWVSEAFAYGKYMHVYDLVTGANVRSKGHGAALIGFLKTLARDAGCVQLHLDSGVQRFEAHKFYLREGFRIASHHFAMDL